MKKYLYFLIPVSFLIWYGTSLNLLEWADYIRRSKFEIHYYIFYLIAHFIIMGLFVGIESWANNLINTTKSFILLRFLTWLIPTICISLLPNLYQNINILSPSPLNNLEVFIIAGYITASTLTSAFSKDKVLRNE